MNGKIFDESIAAIQITFQRIGGIAEIIQAKIIIEIQFQIHFSVICSQSHIKNIVHAAIEKTTGIN
jgi:hypothetical protein